MSSEPMPATGQTTTSDDAGITRLRWQCRRGMLELDLLFDGFLDHGYPQLGKQQQQQFRELLDESDPVLNAWFMGQEQPDNPAFSQLVAQIRRCLTEQSSAQV